MGIPQLPTWAVVPTPPPTLLTLTPPASQDDEDEEVDEEAQLKRSRKPHDGDADQKVSPLFLVG